MKHLNPSQLMEWVESGYADETSREHVKACPECGEQLTALRAVYQSLGKTEAAPELTAAQASQFCQSIQRKIRLLPQPSPLRLIWENLQRVLSGNPIAIAGIVTALLVFSVIAVYRYDKMIPGPTPEAGLTVENRTLPPADLAASMGAAEAVVATQNLNASEILRAFVNSDGTDAAETLVHSDFSTDPFHEIAGLKPEEQSQLKALLKANLKG